MPRGTFGQPGEMWKRVALGGRDAHQAGDGQADLVARQAGTRDVYRLMRAPQGHLEVPVDEAVRALGALRARIAASGKVGAEHPLYAGQTDAEKLDDAVRGLSTYHTRPIVQRSGSLFQVKDVKLLYYYQNRTAHLPPERAA